MGQPNLTAANPKVTSAACCALHIDLVDLAELRSLMVEIQLRTPAFSGEITLMILRYATREIFRTPGYEQLLDKAFTPPLPSAEWLASFRASGTEIPEGDKKVVYDRVIQAMVLLQQAGAPSVGLITQPPEGR